MNFLAHVYLSGSNIPLAVGNLIADRVKGKNIELLDPEIQEGVLLHRAIDTYTDQHPLVRECVKKLFPDYRHYSRVIVDMYFDHFLAAHWNSFHPQDLETFSLSFYEALKNYTPQFPESIQKLISALIKYNWFEQYKTVEGLGLILKQMEQRTKFHSNLAASTEDLKQNYTYFESYFFEFMGELIAFTKTKTNHL